MLAFLPRQALFTLAMNILSSVSLTSMEITLSHWHYVIFLHDDLSKQFSEDLYI